LYADEFRGRRRSKPFDDGDRRKLMQRETQPAPPPRAGRKEWIGLAVIALACVLYVMDLTVLHLAVPAISADLRPSSAELL
jgi:hypothetical protein